VPTQTRKGVEHGVLRGVHVPLRDADIGMPGDTRQRPNVTAALSKSGEKRMTD
jgi:hypothetical protein